MANNSGENLNEIAKTAGALRSQHKYDARMSNWAESSYADNLAQVRSDEAQALAARDKVSISSPDNSAHIAALEQFHSSVGSLGLAAIDKERYTDSYDQTMTNATQHYKDNNGAYQDLAMANAPKAPAQESVVQPPAQR